VADATPPDLVILARSPDGSVEDLPPERLDELDRLTADPEALIWVSATSPDEERIGVFGREFGLHQLALEDLRKQRQRPKVDTYEGQAMIVAYEAVPEAPDGIAEIHVFVGSNWVLSVHWTPTPMLDAVRKRVTQSRDGIATIGQLVYALLDATIDSYFPELDRVSDRIDRLEERVLAGEADRRSLAEILSLKRQLLELRRVLAPMRDVANGLLRRDLDLVDADTAPYYQDLYDHLVRVLDQVDLYRDLLAALLDARLTVASNSLNAIMKRLTAFTVVLMVPTLIAGIYGMNFRHMPELSWPLGYPLALGLMVVTVAVAVTWFRRNDWF
jgi:magnesium transporter